MCVFFQEYFYSQLTAPSKLILLRAAQGNSICLALVLFPLGTINWSTYDVLHLASVHIPCIFTLTMTKKWCSLGDESLDMLIRISYFKEPLDMEATKRVIYNWCKTQGRRLFSDDIWQSIWRSLNVKTTFVLKVFAYNKNLSSVSFILGQELNCP